MEEEAEGQRESELRKENCDMCMVGWLSRDEGRCRKGESGYLSVLLMLVLLLSMVLDGM